jgi:hypothetical protein
MDVALHESLETKAGFAPDAHAHVTHGEMMRTFDAFKAANDERIASIEGGAHRCGAGCADTPDR